MNEPYKTSLLQNCETGIKDFFNSKLFIVGYVGIGIAGVMVSREKRKVRNAHTYVTTDNKMISVFCSTDHWDDFQYGALLCHSQQQGGHLRWILDLCSDLLLYPACKDCTAICIKCHLLSVNHLGSQEVEHVRKNSFPLQCSSPPLCNDLLVCFVTYLFPVLRKVPQSTFHSILGRLSHINWEQYKFYC